jgi:hypothetical protein
MDGINLQASVNNLTQMDRHQQDLSRAPLVHQDQNAVIARDEAEKRIRMPVEPEYARGKKVDTRLRKNDRQERRKKQKKNNSDLSTGKTHSTGSGDIVDIQA